MNDFESILTEYFYGKNVEFDDEKSDKNVGENLNKNGVEKGTKNDPKNTPKNDPDFSAENDPKIDYEEMVKKANETTQNCVGYVRAFEDDEIELQMNVVRDFATKNDLNIIRWVVDNKESGKWEWERLIADEKLNRECSVVVVVSNRVLSTKAKQFIDYYGGLSKMGVTLMSVNYSFSQKDLIKVCLELAEQVYSPVDVQCEGRIKRAKQGKYSGGKLPFGYDLVDGCYVINEREARIVRYIFDEAEKGVSQTQIANDLNNIGCETKKCAKFYQSTIRAILRNENTYRGLYRYGKNGKWVKGVHEPILIDSE